MKSNGRVDDNAEHYKPLVSFCTYTYNSARWIVDLLECAKRQTYSNIELIISDDCSMDNTVQIIRDWIALNGERFSRFILVSTPHNLGYAGNKANAEKYCQGEYIKSIDSDDWVDDTFIEKAVEMLEERKDCAFLYTNSIVVYADRQVMESYHIDGDAFPALFLLDFWPNTPSWFYRREVKENTSYRPEMFMSEDYLRLLEITSRYHVCHLDEYLSYYRRDYIRPKDNVIRWWRSQLIAINYFKDYALYPVRRKQIKDNLYWLIEQESHPYKFINLAFAFKDMDFLHDYYLFHKRKIKRIITRLLRSN